MVCKAPSYLGLTSPRYPWHTWSSRVTATVDQFFTPSLPGNLVQSVPSPMGIQQIVFLVAEALRLGRAIHPIGSGWANTDMALSTQSMVRLPLIRSQLAYVVDGPANALTDAWRTKQADPAATSRLVHFEAGIEVGDAAETMAAQGLAFPTLGGANGQSIAGVVSTSTHGGEWQLPPIPDIVRAIHLVTAGGQELWIERASDPVTVDARLKPVLPCADTRIVRDDTIFNSALVAFGRFGVIYALVLEVRRAFRVAELITRPSLQATLDALEAGRTEDRPFDRLFALARREPFPPGLVEGPALNATAPGFFQLLFNSLDGNDFYLQRRWETTVAQDVNLPEAVNLPVPGVVVTAGLSALWDTLGYEDVRRAVSGILRDQLRPAMDVGRRGPHWLVTSGSRAASHNTTYTGDGIEVVFDASRREYLDFLRAILAAAPGYQQVGWISVRPGRASAATLSMHNVAGPYAMSIEATTATGMRDNEAWLAYVHAEALRFGGRPHWGQFNELNDEQVLALYGKAVDTWRAALVEFSGNSTTFANNFSISRGLEPKSIERYVSVASPAPDELLVLSPPPVWKPNVPGVRLWQSQTGWQRRKGRGALAVSPLACMGAARLRGADRVAAAAIGPEGWPYFCQRRASGTWTAWWIVGRGNDRRFQGVAGGAIEVCSSGANSFHVLYTGRQGRVLVARADAPATGGTLWPESAPLLHLSTRPGGHVTAVSRREGQIDVFAVGNDGRIYTAAWNVVEGWKGWWPIDGITAVPGTHVGAVSKSLDHLDIFVADSAGRTMSAAWQPGFTSWHGWWHIQGGYARAGASITAVSRAEMQLDIFMSGSDTRVSTAAWNPGAGWGGWWAVNGAQTLNRIAAVSRSLDKLDIFYVAGDGSVQTCAWEPNRNWGGPWRLA